MEDAELEGHDAADLAGPGHERQVEASNGGVEKIDGVDDDGPGRSPDVWQETHEKASELSVDRDGEYLDAVPSERVRTVSQIVEWRAPLPPPDVLNEYDEETRRQIVAIHVEESRRESDRLDRIVDGAIENDSRQSDREDLLVEAEIRQSGLAQIGAFVLNLLALIVVLVSLLTNHPIAAAAISAIYGTVSAIKLFVPIRKRLPHEDKDSEDKQ